MKDKDIINVLKQDYQHTVVLHSFEDKIFFFEQNLGTSLDNLRGHNNDFTLKAKCIINQGSLRYCSWDINNKTEKSVEEEEAILEGDIYINNFMFEVHRIYKKAEKDINSSNDTLILQAFSLALESAVIQGITNSYKDEKAWSSIKRSAHYIFIVPTEWEYGIKENIILPIFKQAGLVDEKDHPCKLLFYSELDTVLEQSQKNSKDPYSDKQNLELERGREYILWKLDPINGNKLKITYNCFEASDSKASNRRRRGLKNNRVNALRDPVSVYCSNKVYSLTYIDTIRESVRKFLKDKGIIAVFSPGDMKEEEVMVVIDILIAAAFVCYSKKLKNKEDLTKLSELHPFEDIDLNHYNSILDSEELLKSIDLLEIHGIMFRENEAVIEEVLSDVVNINDGSRSSTKTRRRIVLADNYSRENIARLIELPANLAKDSTKRHQWANTLRIDTELFAKPGEEAVIELSDLYFKWIYCFALKFKNDTNYQTLFDPANLPYCFRYDTNSMTLFAALKFRYNAAFLITRLPPLLLSSTCCFKKDGMLQDSQFTKKSNPVYIVKIDVNLCEPSTFSCVQLDEDKKGFVKAILTTENCEDNNYMSLFPLSHYFKANSTKGSCCPERIYITTRLLEIINTHFKYALDYFSKYDRQKSKNKRLFALEEKLNSKDKATMNEHNECLLPRSFDNLIPKIKLELEKSSREEETKLVEISQQCYIIVFLMIYLGVLKYNISAFIEKKKIGKKGDAADENTTIIGYTVLVDTFFFHTYLKESYSSLIELAIASGFAIDEEDCKANVRVITDREEQLLPVLEQKLGTSLPLKSFYVHGRLYERYLHITLHQVVIEGLLPNQNSKNITIKSKVIATPCLLDMICDNLWDAAQNYNCIVPDASCKYHNEDHASLQEFSLNELEGFKDKILSGAKKLFFTDPISESIGISIPISSICYCKLCFGSEDIFDLGIIPAIKHTVSVLTGAITNENIFGLYGIEHFFVAFNYFSSVFHRSYQDYFKYNLRRVIDINLEKKRLKIPYTVFSEPIGGLLQPVVNESCILADSFLYGNILQVFGETYSLKFRNREVYRKVFVNGNYRMLEEKEIITIVEKGKITPRSGVIKKVFYVRNSDDSRDSYNFFERVVITKRGSSSNNIIDNTLEQSEGLLEEYLVDEWNILSERNFSSDIPLYITVKYLDHSSSVTLSMRMGTGLIYYKEINELHGYSILTERLTIINT